MSQALADWKSQSEEGGNLRWEWSEKARRLNQDSKRQQGQLVHSAPKQPTSLVPQCLDTGTPTLNPLDSQIAELSVPGQVVGGLGAMRLGDAAFPLSEAAVTEADDATPGFVRTFSSAWKTRCLGLVPTPPSFPSHTIKLSCQETYGSFCHSQIEDERIYRQIMAQLRQFVSNFRRLHLHNGKNKGPNKNLQHPLLVLRDETHAGRPVAKLFCCVYETTLI